MTHMDLWDFKAPNKTLINFNNPYLTHMDLWDSQNS